MNGRVWPYMGALVSSCFSFGAHSDIFPLGCGSPLYSIAMTLHKSLILLLIFLLTFFPRNPLCQVVIALSWVFPISLNLMLASLTWIISYIAQACLMYGHVDPFYISFVAWFLILPGGDFPPRVIILHMCPCIEHRYVPLLGTSLFFHWHLSPPSL